ncbi:hypothetical protein ACXET9_13510 [Brachybacterium sp. DNPG3]
MRRALVLATASLTLSFLAVPAASAAEPLDAASSVVGAAVSDVELSSAADLVAGGVVVQPATTVWDCLRWHIYDHVRYKRYCLGL